MYFSTGFRKSTISTKQRRPTAVRLSFEVRLPRFLQSLDTPDFRKQGRFGRILHYSSQFDAQSCCLKRPTNANARMKWASPVVQHTYTSVRIKWADNKDDLRRLAVKQGCFGQIEVRKPPIGYSKFDVGSSLRTHHQLVKAGRNRADCRFDVSDTPAWQVRCWSLVRREDVKDGEQETIYPAAVPLFCQQKKDDLKR